MVPNGPAAFSRVEENPATSTGNIVDDMCAPHTSVWHILHVKEFTVNSFNGLGQVLRHVSIYVHDFFITVSTFPNFLSTLFHGRGSLQ